MGAEGDTIKEVQHAREGKESFVMGNQDQGVKEKIPRRSGRRGTETTAIKTRTRSEGAGV